MIEMHTTQERLKHAARTNGSCISVVSHQLKEIGFSLPQPKLDAGPSDCLGQPSYICWLSLHVCFGLILLHIACLAASLAFLQFLEHSKFIPTLRLCAFCSVWSTLTSIYTCLILYVYKHLFSKAIHDNPKIAPHTSLTPAHHFILLTSCYLLIFNNTLCSHVFAYLVHCLSSPLPYILRYKIYKVGASSVLFSCFSPTARLVPGT